MSEQLFKIYIRDSRNRLRKVEVDEKTYKELLKRENIPAETAESAGIHLQVHPEVEYSDKGKSAANRRSRR